MKRATTVRWVELQVTTNDLACILGIPSVGQRIVSSSSCQVSPDLVNGSNVSSGGIDLKIMVRDTEREIDGGIWFRRSFILVLVIFLASSTSLSTFLLISFILWRILSVGRVIIGRPQHWTSYRKH